MKNVCYLHHNVFFYFWTADLEPVKYSDKTVDTFFFILPIIILLHQWKAILEYLKMRNFDLFFNNFPNFLWLISMIFIKFF
jgi:hypothetical protein